MSAASQSDGPAFSFGDWNTICIAALYRAVLARPPAPSEIQAAARFVAPRDPPAGESGHSQLSRWEQLAQVLLMANELLFVD